MRIIPAIDIIEGKCVRLSKGDYSTKKVYNESPLDVARTFEDHGIKHLHLVDLDGAAAGKVINYHILEEIASKTSLIIDFGGGIKSNEDVRIVFESGARQLTGGSIAVRDKKMFLGWLEEYGPDRIILGADAMDEKVAISGWQEETSEELIPFINSYRKKGVRFVICTDISKDGMLEGPSYELYRKILKKTSIHQTTINMSGVMDEEINGIELIASGGISEMDDLYSLRDIGCEGAIIGKAIYENRIELKELEQFILST